MPEMKKPRIRSDARALEKTVFNPVQLWFK